MKFGVVMTLATLFFHSCATSQPSPSEDFPHQAIVDSRSSNVWLYWRFDDEYITFEMFGKTNGWVGVGISPNGGMIGADMFVGWVKDGNAIIRDLHGGDRNTVPSVDEKQDVTLLDGAEQDGWTRIKFRRPLAACEPDYDITITTSTLKIIWAIGGTDPEGNDLSIGDFHGTGSFNRGVRSLFLLEGNGGPPPRTSTAENRNNLDFISNMTQVPSRDTYYACTMVELPQLPGKRHVIEIAPMIEAGNEDLVHHIIVYQCTQDPKNATSIGSTHECYTDNMPDDFLECASVLHAWAIGGGVFHYPEHVGFPIGTEDSPRFVLVETHYDNPARQSGIVDSSGLRFVYTDNLRQYDAGVLEVGRLTYPFGFMIPPNALSYNLYGECFPECLQAGMEAGGTSSIRMFGALLHTHLLGREVTIHHIDSDGSSELPYIAQDTSYDFNYQEVKVFSKEINFTRGQSIQLVCNYRSTDKSGMTLGGLGTSEEMCLAFIYYYPKIPLTNCLTSTAVQGLYPYFGVQSFYNLNPFNIRGKLSDVVILTPTSLANQTLQNVVDRITWNEQAALVFSEYGRSAPRFRQCLGSANYTGITNSRGSPPIITSPYYPPVPKCPTSSAALVKSNDFFLFGLSVAILVKLLL